MAAGGEDDLICDFAETYHIYDWRKISVKLAATLAAGLPTNSRSIRRLTGLPCSMDTVLLAAAVDRLSLLFWAKTKDGKRGKNPPKQIAESLITKSKEKDIEAFSDVDAFEAARRRLLKE